MSRNSSGLIYTVCNSSQVRNPSPWTEHLLIWRDWPTEVLSGQICCLCPGALMFKLKKLVASIFCATDATPLHVRCQTTWFNVTCFPCRCLPCPGPVVGLGVAGQGIPRAIQYDPDAWMRKLLDNHMLVGLLELVWRWCANPHMFYYWDSSDPFIVLEVGHGTSLKYERVQRAELEKYRVQNKDNYILEASAKLWASGLPWEEAFKIVSEAFEGAITDDM